MSRKVLGIDIRKESVSAVLVKTSLRESRIDAHAHVPISDSAEDENPFKTALETLCSEIDTDGCDCVVSISADHFSYRILQIPFKDAKKIKMVLPFELEPTVPYPVDDLIIDFIDLESVGHNDHTDVIAVAVPKSELIPYLGTLGASKIDPEMVTLSGLPTALCLANQADAGKDQRHCLWSHQVCICEVVGSVQLSNPWPSARITLLVLITTELNATLSTPNP